MSLTFLSAPVKLYLEVGNDQSIFSYREETPPPLPHASPFARKPSLNSIESKKI